MLDQDLTNRIRTIFLDHAPHVSISDAAALLGWSEHEVSQAIAAGEIEVTSTPAGTTLRREELLAKALELWPLDAIEDALGPDAATILPDGLRLHDLHVRLPRHQIQMLQHLADGDQTTISAILTRNLDDMASAHAPELSKSIPGFAAALTWPPTAPFREVGKNRVGILRSASLLCRGGAS